MLKHLGAFNLTNNAKECFENGIIITDLRPSTTEDKYNHMLIIEIKTAVVITKLSLK